jgi:hypothetical protein
VRARAAVAAVLMIAGSARGQTRLSLAPELSVGAGYDDNLFLDPTLTSATPPRADAIIDIRPSLLARLQHRGHSLALDGNYLERVTPSNGHIRDLLLRLDWSSPLWHRLRIAAGPLYEHYEATQFTDNTFDLGGGELSLRLVLSRAWVQVGYRADARAYPDPTRNGQLDVDQWAAATAHVRLHRLVGVDFGYRFLHVASNEPTAVLDRHRAEILLALRPLSWLLLSAGYALWAQALPNGAPPLSSTQPGGPRSDVAHAVDLSVSVRPLPWLELFARYDLIRSTSDASNGSYALDQVVAGVAVGWEFAHEHLPPPPPLLPSVRSHEVTFRARARADARVGVVGDWNSWQPAPLAAVGGGRFEATYALPSGRHAWALWVDGAIVTPPDAAAFGDDGFGGKNAVVDVP